MRRGTTAKLAHILSPPLFFQLTFSLLLLLPLKPSPVSGIQIETHCSCSLPCAPSFPSSNSHKTHPNSSRFPPYIENPLPNSNFQTQIQTSIMAEDPPSSSSSSAVSTSSSPKLLRFFVKFRRIFIQSKRPRKQLEFQVEPKTKEEKEEEKENEEEKPGKREKVEESGEMVMQSAVKKLLFGKWEEREMAAAQIKRLASEDVKIRKSLAELGVVPPLVEMVDSDNCRSAVKALLQLADGTFTNKAVILEAGVLSKLPKDIDKVDESTIHDFSQLLLSISSLSNTRFPLKPSSLILPFLLGTLQSKSTTDKTKEACLGTLYNLSAGLENSGPLISNHVVEILLGLVSSSPSRELSEKALGTLGNLVVTLMGKKALEDNIMVPESLIDVLTWEDKPKCQELSSYILMILAHQSSKQRDKMAKSGIVHVLLEVALLGTPLAQKRALKLLQWFKDQRQVKVGSHSGPQTRRVSIGSPVGERETNEGKRLMKKMVQQSLYKNMEVITRRANVVGESSKLKSLVISSSCKSLPY